MIPLFPLVMIEISVEQVIGAAFLTLGAFLAACGIILALKGDL